MGQKTTLVGESFAPWVKDQVEARQNLLGRRTAQKYTNEELRYINGKTAFLRLVSGVNINSDKGPNNTTRLQDLGLSDSLLGNELAKFFVLEGGTSFFPSGASNGITEFRSGIVDKLNGTNLGDKAYGFASSEQYGYSPMPGLISADIKSLNRGSLKEATVKIKCWNPRQFDIIDTLFIKLKYGMLLEWGHSIYVDNNGEVQNNNFSLANEFLEAKAVPGAQATNSSQQAMYRNIEKYREDSNGNYDAILAYVKNFNWTLNSDNSYDISLSLISIGDVIESLKTNISLDGPNISITGYDAEDQAEAEFPLIKHANRSILDQIFGAVYTSVEGVDDNGGVSGKSYSTGESGDATRISINNLKTVIRENTNPFSQSFPDALKKGLKDATPSNEEALPEIVRLEFSEVTEGQEEAYYVKLGTLLRIIENAFIPKSDVKSENPEPIFRINHTFETDINKGSDLERVALCYTLPVQVSLDPSVCLIPLPEDLDDIQSLLLEDVIQKIRDAKPELSAAEARQYLEDNVDADESWYTFGAGSDTQEIIDNFNDAIKEAKGFNKFLKRKFRRSDSDYIGNMNHIHVNLAYVSNIFSKLINADDGGGVNLYEFLKQIMDGIGTALGGINDFEVVYDSDINFFYIIDNTQLPDGPKIAKELQEEPVEFLINLNDPIGGRGSFVTDTSIKSEISNELAAEISIAAVAPGQSSQNASSTRFQWLNYGTENRILRATEIQNQKTKKDSVGGGDVTSVLENYAFTAQNFAFYLKQVANQYYDVDNASDQRTSVQSILKLASQNIEKAQAEDPKKEGTQARGFIPINLSITLSGLSGPKIYEKFRIPNTFLPSSYKGNVNFLIKEISHTIGDGMWKTSFGSLCVPFTSNEKVTVNTKVPKSTTRSSGRRPTVPTTNPIPSQNPDDYRSLSSGLPHGRPNYPVEGYQYSQGGTKTNAGDGYTIFKTNTSNKTQIFLHHTAGHGRIGAEGTIQTAQGWSKRADHVSTHAIISLDGYTDLLFPDENIGNNTGRGSNQQTLGVEIQSLGYCRQKDGRIIFAASEQTAEPFDSTRVNHKGYIEAVDKFGNPEPYKGHQYYQAYTSAQIDATIQLCRNWINKHNIPFSYDYDFLFPGKSGPEFNHSYKAFKRNDPGIYTHNSVKPGKTDIFPQYDMLVALRQLAFELQQEGRPGCNGDVTDYGPQYPDGYKNF